MSTTTATEEKKTTTAKKTTKKTGTSKKSTSKKAATPEPVNVHERETKRVRVELEKIMSNKELEFTQVRERLNTKTVKDYAERIEADGDALPEVDLFKDESGVYWIGDGFHRVHANVRVGNPEVWANVRFGDKFDALEFAVGANSRHGLPLSNADKRRTVVLILKTSRLRKKARSDRSIEEMTGISQPTISKIRKQLEEEGELEKSSKVVGKDGREYDPSTNQVEGGKNKGGRTGNQGLEEKERKATEQDSKALPEKSESTGAKADAVPETSTPEPVDVENSGMTKTPEPQKIVPSVDGLGNQVPEQLEGVFTIGERMRLEFETIGRAFGKLDEYMFQLLGKSDKDEYELFKSTAGDILETVNKIQHSYQPFAVTNVNGAPEWSSKALYELEQEGEEKS